MARKPAKRTGRASRAHPPKKGAPSRPDPILWDKLSGPRREELFQLATRIARRESQGLEKRYGGHVLGVAVGFRTKGKLRRTYRQIVIRFYVEEKLEEGHADLSTCRIPLALSIGSRKKTRGKKNRQLIEIPTDVTVLSGGRLQRTTLAVQPPAGVTETGSICCVVRDLDTQDTFLLSCKHVLGLVGATAGCDPVADVLIHARSPDEPNVAVIDRPADLAPIFPDQDTFSMDAAIARILRPTTFQRNVDGRPVLSVLQDPDSIRPDDPLTLLSPVPPPPAPPTKRATVVGVTMPIRIPVYCGGNRRVWRFRRLIEYAVSPKTVGGDSGSPLADASILVGMHFYLQEDPPFHGFAMLVKDILDPSVFGRRLELVPDPV